VTLPPSSGYGQIDHQVKVEIDHRFMQLLEAHCGRWGHSYITLAWYSKRQKDGSALLA
jgi:hypothetical protein